MRSLLAFALFLGIAPILPAQDFVLKDGQKVLFLGDSNTYAGGFVAYLDVYLTTQFPKWNVELINLGLPSETCTGLTETDHPFPRPDIHERAERTLTQIKPDVVFVCYGMNDGIYHPWSGERFKKYQEGIQSLIAKIEKAKALPILMTPAPFDPKLVKDTQPADAKDFSYRKPYAQYDDVLAKYSEWLLTLRGEKRIVVDARTPILTFIKEMRKTMPDHVVSKDGIHPSAEGHALIAHAILKELRAPKTSAEIVLDGATKVQLPSRMPWDEKWLPLLIDVLGDWAFKPILKVKNLPSGTYAVSMSKVVGKYTHEELAAGITLEPTRDSWVNTASKDLLYAAQKNQEMTRDHWLKTVAHTRPGVRYEEYSAFKIRARRRVVQDGIKDMQITIYVNPAK